MRKLLRLALVVSIAGLASIAPTEAAVDCCDNVDCSLWCLCGDKGYVCSSTTCKASCFCNTCPF
jgi:hypothetical protein